MAAITDHDDFSYEMYYQFKKQAENLKLVLPRVEFTVAMGENNNLKQIHVITLFNNDDENKIKNIEEIVGNGTTKFPKYDELN